MSEEVIRIDSDAREEQEVGQLPIEPPIIRKKRGRQKGWRKQSLDFQPVEIRKAEPKDEMTLLKEELQTLRNQMSKMRGYQTEEYLASPGVRVENVAFRGRPLPDPLPEGFPEIDPLAGDKTPAVVEWFRDNDPQEYIARYHLRKTHLRGNQKAANPEFITDEETGKRKKMMMPTSDPNLNLSARTYGRE